MVEAWKQRIRHWGIVPEGVEKLNQEWNQGREERINFLCKMIMNPETGQTTDFPTATPTQDWLRRGVYSPVQVLLYECAMDTKSRLEIDYPFCFSTMGRFLSILMNWLRTQPESVTSIDKSNRPSKKPPIFYQRILQSVFQLREITVEREALSLEIQLPINDNCIHPVPIDKLAQVFGRGIAITNDCNLAVLEDAGGTVEEVFPNHDSAPLATLYTLDQPFNHIDLGEINLILRRDGHLTIAVHQNPLVEFYDGGWHIVDLGASRSAIETLICDVFKEPPPQNLTEYILRLSYHMATHWHGGIISVVDDEVVKRKGILEAPNRSSRSVSKEIKKCMQKITKERNSRGSLLLSDCLTEEAGLGRLLMSAAIQDGALLISPDGRFIDAGRIVAKSRAKNERKLNSPSVDGGARSYAAFALSKHGVVMKISQDGGIKLFSNREKTIKRRVNGLRIH
jgi:hypothetical protein